ncbi:large subunit ribosomal protein L25 [Elusimicrobium simillimum]|uniref:50S ribosomal protein L25 n=1 Tax=Elusimicrobium simillimum TaxID=3143438 RepID=UPI003C7005F8
MEIKINAEVREKAGVKGALSSIRAAKNVPAVIYGGKKEPVVISIAEKDLNSILKSGANTIVTLTLPAGEEKAIIKEVQYHVVKDTPNHVDFLRISMTEKIEVVVPVKLIGESPDVKMYGAMVNQVLRELHVRALPAAIPHEILVDIKTLTIAKPITIADLGLSKDVEVVGGDDRAIVHLMVPRAEAEEAAPADAAAQPESSSTKGKKDEDGNVAKK